jgi:hypothetical protein
MKFGGKKIEEVADLLPLKSPLRLFNDYSNTKNWS